MMNNRKKDEHEKKGFLFTRIGHFVIGVFIVLVLMVACVNSADDQSSEETSSSHTSNVVKKEESSVKVTSISASYNGDTDAGTVLDNNNNNDKIVVTATYSDDSQEEVNGWNIKKSVTLQAGKTAKVTIDYQGCTCVLKVACTTLTKAQIRQKLNKTIPYEKLARYPDKYKGKALKIYGQVIQVMQDEDNENEVELRVSTKNDGYGWYDDVVYVGYTYKTNDKKILEDDMVTIYGLSAGTVTYESTNSGNITIPAMLASVIDIH